MWIVLAALISEPPPLPQMPTSVGAAYMKYSWCITDAAKLLAGRRGDAPELFPIAKDACSKTRMHIEAALDVEAASKAADLAADGNALAEQPLVSDQMAITEATMSAIDRYLEVIFAAHLKNFRTEQE